MTASRAVGMGVAVLAAASIFASGVASTSCTRRDDAPLKQDPVATRAAPSIGGANDGDAGDGGANGAPRAGMAWIAPGVLRAGTPPERTPRVAEEELPGTPIELQGFYIDLYPYPDEPDAIPTTNVSRDEATRKCEERGKRLCTEFEWERACKGPSNLAYEYGDSYRAAACETGVAVDLSSRRPSGEHPRCKSDFGVFDMHGIAWEWTASPYRRGTTDVVGVLRGGNSSAGDVTGRCANAIGRSPAMHTATMGFRCCAGPVNAIENTLVVKRLPPLERRVVGPETKKIAESLAAAAPDPRPGFDAESAYVWRPVANEELLVVAGCADPAHPGNAALCGAVVWRATPTPTLLSFVDTGRLAPGVATKPDATTLRLQGLDVKGTFVQTATYAYGKVFVP